MPSSKRTLPILFGEDRTHVMAEAIIDEEPGNTQITIVVQGDSAQYVAAFLTAPEPIAMRFVGIPVQPRKNHIKEH